MSLVQKNVELPKQEQSTKAAVAPTSKKEVDIERLQAYDLKEIELPSIANKRSARERTKQLEEQLLRGRNTALVMTAKDGGDVAYDLTNATMRKGRAGELQADRQGPSSFSLDSLSNFLGKGVSQLASEAKLLLASDERGVKVNGQFQDPRVISTQQFVAFQGPQTQTETGAAPEQQAAQVQAPERVQPGEIRPLSKEQLSAAFSQILKDETPGAKDRIAVFMQRGELIAMPFQLVAKQGEQFVIKAPQKGGAKLSDADITRIREVLELDDSISIRSSSKVSLEGTSAKFKPGVIGNQHGLEVEYKGVPLGDPIPVLGVLRRQPNDSK